jgi:hypothetical protein
MIRRSIDEETKEEEELWGLKFTIIDAASSPSSS